MAKLIRLYKPLHVSLSLITISSTLSQEYDVNTKTYTPDRRIIPTIIQPIFKIIDPSKKLVDGIVNKELVAESIKWFMGEPDDIKLGANDGIQKAVEIKPDNPYFTIDSTSNTNNRGRLTVRLNTQEPIKLFFQATFIDNVKLGGEVKKRREVSSQGEVLLSTNISASSPLELIVDYGRGDTFNPFTDYAKMKINADILTGQTRVPAAYWWYRKNLSELTLLDDFYDGHNEREINIPSYEIGDRSQYFVEVQDCREDLHNLREAYFIANVASDFSNAEEVRNEANNLQLPIGYRPSTKDPNKILSANATLRTSYPRYEVRVVTDYGNEEEIIEIPSEIDEFDAWVEIRTHKGIIEDPEKYFDIDWGNGLKGERVTINADWLGLGFYTLEPRVIERVPYPVQFITRDEFNYIPMEQLKNKLTYNITND